MIFHEGTPCLRFMRGIVIMHQVFEGNMNTAHFLT